MAPWLSHSPSKPGVAGLIPDFSSTSDKTINRGPMTIFQDKTGDEAGDYAVPNVLSARDLVFSPDLRTKNEHTHTSYYNFNFISLVQDKI